MRAVDAAGNTLLFVIHSLLQIAYWMVFVWVILSWIVFFMARSKARWKYPRFFETLMVINDFLNRATSPLLWPFRRILPPSKTGGIDWSPLLLLIAIIAIQRFLWLTFGQY